MIAFSRRCLAAGISLCAFQTLSAQAQTLPDFIVTPTRSPQAITRAGSAVSVITAEEIARESAKSVADLLRRVPGVDVTETGGPGQTTNVRVRGAEARHTLVLIDGVRVNDPSAATGEFDFATLVPTDIERIEVLRGPQSALYGSDAIGGVIAIITRKGRGAPRFTAQAEAGSYGTKSARAGVSGGAGPLSYAFSVTGYDTAGFSAYGARIGRIERGHVLPLEADSVRRLGATGRVGIALGENVELEFGGHASGNRAQYDNPFSDPADTPSLAEQRLYEGYTRLSALAFDGILKNTVLVSVARTDRDYNDVGYYFGPTPSQNRYGYTGDRTAAEYQGDLKLGALGLFTFGAKIERERLVSTSQAVLPFLGPREETADLSQNTRSVFALHQISPMENLHVSLGGRLDDVENGGRFGTWRATAAYEIPRSGTTLRTSLGTGAKAPSLFQQFDPIYGTPGLGAERSFGIDAGVDQRLFDDRVMLSGTVFLNRIRDLIDFSFDPGACPPSNPFGCYVNVSRARTSGVELAASLEIVPDWLHVKAAYTYLRAVDLETDKPLARRPEHSGRVGLAFTPLRGLSLEPSVVFVGERFSSANERNRLAPYARLDILADYRVNDTFSVFARAENVTDAKYQEVYDYGTAGRSFYAGLRATW